MTSRPCVVTGAASGIGRAIADDLRAAGRNVAYLDLADMPHLAGEPRAMALRCDVTDERAVAAAFDAVRERFGAPVWACFADAGVSGGSDDFLDVTLDHFTDIVHRNLTGAFLTMREAARAMGDAGGRIVATASVAGRGIGVHHRPGRRGRRRDERVRRPPPGTGHAMTYDPPATSSPPPAGHAKGVLRDDIRRRLRGPEDHR